MKNLKFKTFFSYFLIFVALIFSSVFAQYPQQQPQSIEQMLLWQDQQIMQQFASKFVPDYRYYGFIDGIMKKMNPYLPSIYGNKPYIWLNGACFASMMGFNAITGYRIIIFDSLLLDGLKRLADAVAVYGNLNNDYSRGLAQAIVTLMKAHSQGYIRPNTSNLNNPFNLPTLTNLTPEQKPKSEKLFTNMVASWVAHEASHGFLEHIKEKMQIQQTMQAYYQRRYPPEQAQQQIQYYLNYTLSPLKEFEADTMATRLLIKSGYDVDGFIWWLRFADTLEALLGTNTSYMRTHPKSEQRVENIMKTLRDKARDFRP
jgi:hypothetical protein